MRTAIAILIVGAVVIGIKFWPSSNSCKLRRLGNTIRHVRELPNGAVVWSRPHRCDFCGEIGE